MSNAQRQAVIAIRSEQGFYVNLDMLLCQ
jgi:hypothetical protein